MIGPGESGLNEARGRSDCDAFWNARKGRVFVDEEADLLAPGFVGSDSVRFEGRR